MIKASVTEATRPDTRESRALALHRSRGRDIVLIDRDTYEVPSQDGARVYEVRYGDLEACNCPDHTYRGATCVHIYAVGIHRAKRRGATARRLAALEDRAAHEDLAAGERLEILDEIRGLRRRLGL